MKNEWKESLLKQGWHDKYGNTLTFFETKEDLFLCIDGGDCSEGVEEKIECNLDCIVNLLDWYGYQELKSVFLNAVKSKNKPV